jgi:serine/threonine protein phosphatase PrpC
VSRAFGDLDCKYISQEPSIYNYELDNDKFIILGCDGIWDVLSCQDAVDFVMENIIIEKKLENKGEKSKNNNIAYKLADYALQKGSQDNLSVIIIFLI